MTLTEFLLARIAEDEQTIRVVTNNGKLSAVGGVIAEAMVDIYTSGRMLAECEAKRRIIQRIQYYQEWHISDDFSGEQLCDDLLELLALPYADHPDYRDEWRS